MRGGSKFVLVVDGKVFQIANQDNKDLATHAGHTVKMTGELKGSGDYGVEDRDAVRNLQSSDFRFRPGFSTPKTSQ